MSKLWPEWSQEVRLAAAARIRHVRENARKNEPCYITRVYDPVWTGAAVDSDYQTDLNLLADWACEQLEEREAEAQKRDLLQDAVDSVWREWRNHHQIDDPEWEGYETMQKIKRLANKDTEVAN